MSYSYTKESKQKLLEGARKSALIGKEKSYKLREKYEANPKKCLFCETPISYEKKRNKYCNASCAATVNNSLYPKRTSAGKRGLCLHCGGELAYGKKYCSAKCQHDKEQAQWIEEWLSGKIRGGEVFPSSRIKKYLIKIQAGACSICGLDMWLDQPIGLIMDHINGDPTNHAPDNLRLICANCDMQLPTYKARNKGKGRLSRKERYNNGESY